MRARANRASRTGLALIIGSSAVSQLACDSTDRSTQSAPAPAGSPAQESPLSAGSRARIAGGTFKAGTVPGTHERLPELEHRLRSVTLGPFEIDRLFYPNDPAQPARVNVSRKEAERLCAERSGRLCTELEWERTCKGNANNVFSTGESWKPDCGKAPEKCRSEFDVAGMGALREWTASNLIREGKPLQAIVRGAGQDASASAHRCAHRRPSAPNDSASDLSFRCCYGPPNAAKVETPDPDNQVYAKVALSVERFGQMLKANPTTEGLAGELMFFSEPEAARTVVDRGPGDRKGFSFTVAPLSWKPVAGAEFLVVTGRSGKDTSFVLAYHVIDDDDYRLASSFILENEPGPVALAYSDSIRPRLHFSTCWGCLGETGKILYRDPDSVIILQP